MQRSTLKGSREFSWVRWVIEANYGSWSVLRLFYNYSESMAPKSWVIYTWLHTWAWVKQHLSSGLSDDVCLQSEQQTSVEASLAAQGFFKWQNGSLGWEATAQLGLKSTGEVRAIQFLRLGQGLCKRPDKNGIMWLKRCAWSNRCIFIPCRGCCPDAPHDTGSVGFPALGKGLIRSQFN